MSILCLELAPNMCPQATHRSARAQGQLHVEYAHQVPGSALAPRSAPSHDPLRAHAGPEHKQGHGVVPAALRGAVAERRCRRRSRSRGRSARPLRLIARVQVQGRCVVPAVLRPRRRRSARLDWHPRWGSARPVPSAPGTSPRTGRLPGEVPQVPYRERAQQVNEATVLAHIAAAVSPPSAPSSPPPLRCVAVVAPRIRTCHRSAPAPPAPTSRTRCSRVDRAPL